MKTRDSIVLNGWELRSSYWSEHDISMEEYIIRTFDVSPLEPVIYVRDEGRGYYYIGSTWSGIRSRYKTWDELNDILCIVPLDKPKTIKRLRRIEKKVIQGLVQSGIKLTNINWRSH